MKLPQSFGRVATATLVFFIVLIGCVGAHNSSADECLECHGDTLGEPTQVTTADLADSIHYDNDCSDCHEDLEILLDEMPTEDGQLVHGENPSPVDCSSCHDDIADEYTQHGLAKIGESDVLPSCANCHGSHEIRGIDDPESLVNPEHLGNRCAACHEDVDFTASRGLRFKRPIEVFDSSVHGATRGMAALDGLAPGASCKDCHFAEGSAHRILSRGATGSSINHFNIPATCGRCHEKIEKSFWEGVHGQLTERGEVEAPVCTSCHGEHNILKVSDPRSPVNPRRLAESTCSPCHESAALNDRYQLPTGAVRSFQDSYHGLKSKGGDRRVANCASCHGAHRILNEADPLSTTHPDNLQTTCGNCHGNITSDIAQVSIHKAAEAEFVGIAAAVQKMYMLLICVVIGGMALHWLLDLLRSIKKTMKEGKQVRRMDGDEVVQHFIMALTFAVLVVTGFSLRFYDSWWSEWIFSWDGGHVFRGNVHRTAGVVMMLSGVWHIIYLTTARGRQFITDMLPSLKDLEDFKALNNYNLGRSTEHPNFGRFTYAEKAEYWALLWGTFVMLSTGFFLWFDNVAVEWFPRFILDVILVIHYYEAWLAFLAIIVWHLYGTVFRPAVYPGNPSWFTGFMPEEQFKAEHPGAMAGSNREQIEYLETHPEEKG